MRTAAQFLFLVVLLAFLVALDIAVGSVSIPLSEVVASVWGDGASKESWQQIIWQLRLPRVLTALCAGSALAVSGLLMQTLFRNPLAGPFVLGINSGASLAVALVLLGGSFWGLSSLSDWMRQYPGAVLVASSVGAAVVLLLVLAMSARVRDAVSLLILGLMFGYFSGAIVNVLTYFSAPQDIQSYLIWTYGSFAGVTWDKLNLMLWALLPGLVGAMVMVKSLDAFLLGESHAQSLGFSVKRLRHFLIVISALLAGAVTAFCGPIGFVGVAVPHLCRGFFMTSRHRLLVPACALMGACLAVLADVVAQVPGQSTILPVNAVTALIGAPVLVMVILKRFGRSQGLVT